MIRKNTFRVYKDYNLDGTSGEGVSWRNVQGNPVIDVLPVAIDDVQTTFEPVPLLESGFNIPAAGIYTVQMDYDSYVEFKALRNAINRGAWASETEYALNDIVTYDDVEWRCIRAHTSSIDIHPGYGVYSVLSWVIYTIEELNDSHPLLFNIWASDSHDILSPAVETQVAIDCLTDDYQPQIIPGLKIKLSTIYCMTMYDKFQILVGAKWIPDEDRYEKDFAFGEVESETDDIEVFIENISGSTLTNIRAKIVNKISVMQSQLQMDGDAAEDAVNALSPYYVGEDVNDEYAIDYTEPYGNAPFFKTHPMDLIVPTRGPNWRGIWTLGTVYYVNDGVSNLGNYYVCKVSNAYYQPGVTSGWRTYWRLQDPQVIIDNPQIKTYSPSIGHYGDKTYIPFQRDVIFNRADTRWTAYGETSAYMSNGYPIEDWYSYLRYDFGPGNFVKANVIGLSGIVYSDSGNELWGSEDDFDNPENWDLLLSDPTMGATPYSYGGSDIGGYIIYNAFPNNKYYRHYAIKQTTEGHFLTAFALSVIEIVELIYSPITSYNVFRNRPFVLLDQSSGYIPTFRKDDYPHDIRFENYSSGLADLVINDNNYNVINFYTGVTILGGLQLNADGLTRYQLTDDSPYPGLNFIISPSLADTDRAELYVSNGADAFEIKKNDDWVTSGQECVVSDSMIDDEIESLTVRANPKDRVSFPDDVVEGLLQIMGEEEIGIAIFSDKALTDNLNSSQSIRVIIPTFAAKGLKVRFKFYAIVPFESYIQSIEDVYFGRRKTEATFDEGKVNLLFDGESSSTSETSIWTDWVEFDYDGSYEHLLSFHGGRGLGQEESDFSYYVTSDNGIKTSSGDYATAANLEEGVCAITDMEIMMTDTHITSIPLSTIVKTKFPEMNIRATLIDSVTAGVLQTFGISSGIVS
jgi:hypothetical protein